MDEVEKSPFMQYKNPYESYAYESYIYVFVVIIMLLIILYFTSSESSFIGHNIVTPIYV